MTYPFVSIVIPAFNSAPTLCNTIKACLEQDYPKDKLEIIVVDDGSTDNTREIVKGLQVSGIPVPQGCGAGRYQVKDRIEIKYIYQARKGPATARNLGWRSSAGEVLCFIDADCVPCVDWVSKLAQHCDKDGIGAVAGSYDASSSPYLLDKFVHHEIRLRHLRMGSYVNSFGTYNVLIKRRVLEELDGFDPGYAAASGEDTDLSYRIAKAGYKIYFEKASLVRHFNILRFWKYMAAQFRHGYWRMRIYKHNISMLAQDKYGGWKDFLETFLGMVFIAAFFLNFTARLWIISAAAFFIFIIQLQACARISSEQKDPRYLMFIFIMFVRVFVRVSGGMAGFVRFWIFRK